MKIREVENRSEILTNQLLEVWESSVKATHLFLSEEGIAQIKTYVQQAIQGIEHLIVAEDQQPVGFMGIDGQKLEMLFIHNDQRGKGIGKQLIQLAKQQYHVNELCVNEQNPQAKGFYEHMGFEVVSRSELDDQGNPYPILTMKLKAE